MAKRLFICADRHFPRGDAGANRLLYIAKALKERDWEILVLSMGEDDPSDYEKEVNCFRYEGITYSNLKISDNRFISIFERRILIGRKFISTLKKYKLTNADCVLVYSSYYPFTEPVFNYCNSIGAKIVCDVVEWHQAFQYGKGEKDIEYRLYKRFFYTLPSKCRNIMAISRKIEDYFRQLNCNVLRLPIFVEATGNSVVDYIYEEGTLNLIYPGNPYRKDDMLSMLQAVDALRNESQVVLHSTGVSEERLAVCVPANSNLLERLKMSGNVAIHGKIPYDELLMLYHKMDFALVARPENQVTLSNFPSKIPELMNQGIPSITNKIGDIFNYLEDGFDAILYEGTGAEACVNAIKRVLVMNKNQIARIHKQAKAGTETKFDYRLYIDALDQYMTNLE